MPRSVPARARRLVLLLVGTVLFLAVTVVAGYSTRLSLVRATAWVEHTDEVKLAIAECQLDLERWVSTGGDLAALAALRMAEERVRELTADNPRQRERLQRAVAMTSAPVVAIEGFRSLLLEMRAEEDVLMAGRKQELEDVRGRSAVVFVLGATLTLAFASLSIVLLQRNARVLARAFGELHREQALLESVVESVSDAVLAVNERGEFVVMNQAARDLLGSRYPRDRLPADWRPLIAASYEDGSPMKPEDGPLARAVRGESVDQLVYSLRQLPDGKPVWLVACSSPVRGEDGGIVAGVVTMHDVTEQKLHAQELSALSVTDELTKLHNRRGFLLLAEQHLRMAARTRQPFGLLFADLNGLKRINDDLGHDYGDRAICDAAQVLRGIFRDSDVVARLGGDEFVVLLANATSSTSGAVVARLSDGIRAHNARGGLAYRVSMSTGLAFYDPEHPETLQELLVEADRRMYAAKRDRQASGPMTRVIP